MKRLVFCLVGLVAVLGMASTGAAGVTLTSVADGDWNAPSTWDDGILIPTEDYDVVVKHAVTVATDGAASSLFVNGGDLFVEPDNTLSVVGGVQVAEGALGIEGTISAGSAHVTSALLYLASTGELNLTGDFLVEDHSEYMCAVGRLTNGLATAGGRVRLNDDNYLDVRVAGESEIWDDPIRTIVISETGIDGTFVIPHPIPGDVVWRPPMPDYYTFDVDYTDCTVDVRLHFHCGGFTDAHAAMLATHWQQCGVTWSEGDFNEDDCVNDHDAAIVATHWYRGMADGAVPEPSILTLLATGAIGLSAFIWRRPPSVERRLP